MDQDGAWMSGNLRETGFSFLNEISWGTHFCHFYDQKQDLLDTFVLYFKTGLAANECCVCALCDALPDEEVRNALRAAVGDLDGYEAEGRLEIIAGRNWYLTHGLLDQERVLSGWTEKLNRARGDQGLRVCEDTSWL
jgi:MEDS: MEthanogen/methylotroph, DcmR Sensory domain